MAAATSLMRAQQLVLAAVEDELRPFGLTFSSYEALMLLSFTRRGEMPLGKMSDRLMVHPASHHQHRRSARGEGASSSGAATSTTGGGSWPRSRRPGGRSAAEATEPLNKIQFGLGMLDEAEAATVNRVLRPLRAGDMAEDVADPWT